MRPNLSKDLYSDFFRANRLLKKIQERRNELRDMVLGEAQRENFGKDYLLPVKSLRVPKSYFEATGQTINEFAELRYPGWNLSNYSQDGEDAILIFRKKEIYASFSHQGQYKTDVIASEATPQMDWQTLEQEFPGLMDRIASPKITYELDEDKFAQELNENSDLPEILQRHIISKEPTLRVTSKEIKASE